MQLAEDIQRNGLMHNLVVFPQEENGKTVYVLLSGERRYRAMEYLEKRGRRHLEHHQKLQCDHNKPFGK